ncbi:hypothetical protein LSM04_009013 [Trypanosoma melophagium]|uniref:uncharacterized protein n=1 Tax=Trypanosoma melophagium TaxID=715481 RepID=UPI00351A40C7|nr:hypothetical protein LSM04_009013 [Trypanosoma melophagium]
MMDVKERTDTVLAFADDVIASIGIDSSVTGIQSYSKLDKLNSSVACFNVAEKSTQTEIISLSKATQSCISTKNTGIQVASVSVHRSTQINSCQSSASTQTDPDMSVEVVKDLLRNSMNMVFTKLLRLERLCVNLLGRFGNCGPQLRRLSHNVNSLKNSENIAKENLNTAHAALRISSLLMLELENRNALIEEEMNLRYNMVSIAHSAAITFFRESEKAFLSTRSELFDKLDYIDVLQKQLHNQIEGNGSMTANTTTAICSTDTTNIIDTNEGCDCLSGKNLTDFEDDNESLKDMKKLLTECWVLLGQDT